MLNLMKAPFVGRNKDVRESQKSVRSDGADHRSILRLDLRGREESLVAEVDLREQYKYTMESEDKFQQLRDNDFARLDEQDCVYLDFTGAALAPKHLVDEHAQMMNSTILGNPHSQNAPSLASTKMDSEARQSVLDFFCADPSEYEVVWTANASAALRVVGECYPFSEQGAFLYAPDCHNSVNGIFQYATRNKARTGGFRFLEHTLNYDWASFSSQIEHLAADASGPKLMALPGESNASGLKHNVRRYADHAHEHGWNVLLDAAAMAPTNPIDMNAVGKPEFVSLSFYKIFGYPTGIGCLLAKRSALQNLHKPWFCGGTVRYVGVSSSTIIPLEYNPGRHEEYEDGTINFQATGAVTAGIRYMQNIGMEDLELHVKFLSALTEMKLRELTWGNGAPLVYIPPNMSDDDQRGHALPVVFLAWNGELLHHKIVESILSARGIAVRTGCFCNPGSSQQILMNHFDTFGKNMDIFVEHHLRYLQFKGRLDEMVEKGASQGYVRISFGAPTNRADVERLITCVKEDILGKPDEIEARMKRWKEKPDIPYSLC